VGSVQDVKLVLAVSLAGAGAFFGLVCDLVGFRRRTP
jgi:hypothetical protein